MPTRLLPADATLERVRDDARRLMRGHKQGDPAALQRIREFLPRCRGAGDDVIASSPLKWSDALLAVSREYGFATWMRLKARLERGGAADGRPHDERIDDALFRHAVALLDAGDQPGLAAHLAAHPDLARRRVAFEGGNYFRNPNLLAFIAENPVRRGLLPKNAVAIAETVLAAGGGEDRAGLDETLALVASGRVARECGVQGGLIELLCRRGADPAAALQPALADGEFEAARMLLLCGATATLSVAAALGRDDDARTLLAGASPAERHLALANAAQHGHEAIVRLLLDAGEAPSRYNPEGAHAHSTPLHQAAWHGHEDVVRLLVARGARRDLRDTIFRGTPADWAERAGRPALAAALRDEDRG